jgi:hypothetical protein
MLLPFTAWVSDAVRCRVQHRQVRPAGRDAGDQLAEGFGKEPPMRKFDVGGNGRVYPWFTGSLGTALLPGQ